MFCRNCGNQISDTAKFCTKCGYRVEAGEANTNAVNETPANYEVNNVAPEAPVNTAANNAPNATVNQTANTVTYAPTPTETTVTAVKKKRRKPSKKVFIIGGVVLAAVIAVAAFNFSALANFVRVTFSSPEDYYQYVEGKAFAETASMTASIYENLFHSNLKISDQSVTANVSFELGEEALDMLSAYTYEDFSWLKTISATAESNTSGNKASSSISVSLGDDKLLTYNAVIDMDTFDVYMQIPELSDSYMQISMSDYVYDYDYNEFVDVFGMLATIYDKCPDQATVEKVLNRYLTAVVECIDNVDKDSSKLSARGVSQKYTTLEVTIDSKTVTKVMKSVFKEMLKDADLEKIIIDIAELAESEGVDPKDVYEQFTSSIEMALEELDEADLGMDDIIMTVWVDNDGNIRGRKIETAGVEFMYAMPMDGDKYGLEISVNDGYEEVLISGKGKLDGDLLSGDFSVEAEGMSLVEIAVDNYDMEKIKDGYINGTFKITPSSDIMSDMTENMGMPASITSVVEDYGLVLKINSSKSSWGFELGVESDAGSLISMKGSVATEKSKGVAEVKGAVGMEEWINTVDIAGFMDSLRDTDIPGELLDELERSMNYDGYYEDSYYDYGTQYGTGTAIPTYY